MNEIYLLKRAFKHAIKGKEIWFYLLTFFTFVILLGTLHRNFHYDAEFEIWVFSSRAWFLYDFLPFWGMTIFTPLAIISVNIMFETLLYFKELKKYEKNQKLFT